MYINNGYWLLILSLLPASPLCTFTDVFLTKEYYFEGKYSVIRTNVIIFFCFVFSHPCEENTPISLHACPICSVISWPTTVMKIEDGGCTNCCFNSLYIFSSEMGKGTSTFKLTSCFSLLECWIGISSTGQAS